MAMGDWFDPSVPLSMFKLGGGRTYEIVPGVEVWPVYGHTEMLDGTIFVVEPAKLQRRLRVNTYCEMPYTVGMQAVLPARNDPRHDQKMLSNIIIPLPAAVMVEGWEPKLTFALGFVIHTSYLQQVVR